MSEHEHDWLLEGGRRYFYCECGETGSGIEDLWNERIKNQAHIKALEGVVEQVWKLERLARADPDFFTGTLGWVTDCIVGAPYKLEEDDNV